MNSTNPRPLRVGDRVQYRGTITTRLNERNGTVTRLGPESGNGASAYVRFDGDANEYHAALMESSLHLSPYQNGDRVAYVGNPNQANGGEECGWHGTVNGFDSTGGTKVRWDAYSYGDDTGYHGYPQNSGEILKLDASVSPPTEAWVAAYNLLEKLGDIHFTIKPEPFKAIDCGYINANEDYRVTVYADNIKVGCQRISFETADRIMEAVAKAREWQQRRPQTFTNMPQAPK